MPRIWAPTLWSSTISKIILSPLSCQKRYRSARPHAGTRYCIPISGCADRSVLSLQPFLQANAPRLRWHADAGATPSLAPTNASADAGGGYRMPAEALLLGTPAVPQLLVAYLNATTLKGPFVDLQLESMESRGKVRTFGAVLSAPLLPDE